jgi:GNAT superfamily N-acetyltransferase
MAPADVDQIVAAFLGDGWGDRRMNLDFAVAHPQAYPVVADADGMVVGTGLVTVHGASGWIGTVWVDRAWRRRGLGRALTQATIDAGEAAGARAFLLVATDEGRPLYEGLGFEVQTWYQMFEAPGLGEATSVPKVRPFDPADLTAVIQLDRAVTGEDRAHLHRAFAHPDTARVLVRDDGSLGGFVVRAPWGGGATIAPAIDDASALLHARRIAAGPDKVVRAGLLDENEAGRASLLGAGWIESWRAPRLVRGEPPAWQPTAIWGQFNLALG